MKSLVNKIITERIGHSVVGPPPSGSFLLLETSTNKFLLENGTDKILLEV